MTRAKLLVVVVAVAVAVTLTVGTGSAATVGPGVSAQIQAQGRARVVVSLHLPEVSALGVESLRARVAQIQAKTTEGLAPEEFQATASWRAVPGLAGFVTAAGIEKLAARPEVDRVDLDVSGRAQLATSVPLIRADLVQAGGNTGQGVTVAVLDSGVTTSHPDLADDIVAEQCYCVDSSGFGCCPDGATSQSGSGAARDDNGHGTNVTGIITGNGTVAPKGVAPGTKVVAVRVLAADGSFSGIGQVISGLDFIITDHPEVKAINMSLGTSMTFTGDCDDAASWTQSLASAVNTLTARGTAVVASAGNDTKISEMEAPACVANTVSVGAVYKANVGAINHSWAGCSDSTTAADKVVCFSNSGANLDIMAPGSPIVSAGRSGVTSTYSGTSQASPHVAAVFALAFGKKPTATVAEILAAMKATGKAVADPRNGLSFKRVDAKATVDSLTTPGGSYSYWVPVASHTTGVNNSQWRTAVGVLNAGTVQANLELRWYAPGGVETSTTFVAAGAQSILDDVVLQIGASLSGSAALEIRSDQPVRVTSRTYNLVGATAPCYVGKTFGQDYPVVQTADGLSAAHVVYLGQLTENSSFRCNIALLNTSGSAAAATVELHDGAGTLLTSYPVTLAAGDWKQEGQPFLKKAGQTNMSRGWARVTVTSGSGVFACASVVDAATGDPTTIWMLK